jgi:hypothetical protein
MQAQPSRSAVKAALSGRTFRVVQANDEPTEVWHEWSTVRLLVDGPERKLWLEMRPDATKQDHAAAVEVMKRYPHHWVDEFYIPAGRSRHVPHGADVYVYSFGA